MKKVLLFFGLTALIHIVYELDFHCDLNKLRNHLLNARYPEVFEIRLTSQWREGVEIVLLKRAEIDIFMKSISEKRPSNTGILERFSVEFLTEKLGLINATLGFKPEHSEGFLFFSHRDLDSAYLFLYIDKTTLPDSMLELYGLNWREIELNAYRKIQERRDYLLNARFPDISKIKLYLNGKGIEIWEPEEINYILEGISEIPIDKKGKLTWPSIEFHTEDFGPIRARINFVPEQSEGTMYPAGLDSRFPELRLYLRFDKASLPDSMLKLYNEPGDMDKVRRKGRTR